MKIQDLPIGLTIIREFFMIKKIIVLSSCTIMLACQTTSDTASTRKPASTQDLFTGAEKILTDVQDANQFNAQNCPAFIDKATEYLYKAPANYFIPKTEDERQLFKAKGQDLINTIFMVRTKLRERFQDFDAKGELSFECTQKMREAFRYIRFTEEYVLDWLYREKVLTFKETPILTNEAPATWTNPKFANFKLQTGDLMMIRGKAYVSAMIARIADEEGNFSHLALVGEDSAGHQYVVEALIQYGVIITPLEKWRKAQDARVVLFRQRDPALAKRAGRVMYDHAKEALDKGSGIRYDFTMNDNDYTSMFCSEVGKYAYDKASNGKLILPKFRSQITKFKGSDYPKSLGVTANTLFAPYDMEVDPRFDFVAEFRYYPLLNQVRMQDAVFQSIYDWMIQKKYTFHPSLWIDGKALLGKAVRQIGLEKETLPTYMPIPTIKTTLKFEGVATPLQNNIYAKSDEFLKRNGYLPSFEDLMGFNDEYRKKDCILQEQASHVDPYEQPSNRVLESSKFHAYFYGPSCE
jgi:hypothetical protein